MKNYDAQSYVLGAFRSLSSLVRTLGLTGNLRMSGQSNNVAWAGGSRITTFMFQVRHEIV